MTIENNISVDAEKVIQFVEKLDFPRVLGTNEELRAFEIIREELTNFRICTEYESFVAPWIDFKCSYIEIGGKHIPTQPLISPIYNNRWLSIPGTVDIKGTLTDVSIQKKNTGSLIALREHCDIERPWTSWASAQLFVHPPDDSFIAYFLASEKPPPSAFLTEANVVLSDMAGRKARFRWDSKPCKRNFRNMAAEIKGTEIPNEIIVIGAHIDSFPGTAGASDNAAGAVLLLELVKWFARHLPIRTVRFVWFTGEELDCRGSHAYMTRHANDSDDIRLYVNVDTGFSTQHGKPYVTLTGKKTLTRKTRSLLLKNDYEVPVSEANSASGDGGAFYEHGIPTVWACAKNTKPYPHPHLPTDRFDGLDPENIALIGNLSLTLIDAAQSGVLL